MRHIIYCLAQALRHPRIAALGAYEFRRSATTHFEDEIESYDSGRELAHLVTLRHWDD